jgi:hypothetical protein
LYHKEEERREISKEGKTEGAGKKLGRRDRSILKCIS